MDLDTLVTAHNHPLYQRTNERLSAHTSSDLALPQGRAGRLFYSWDVSDAPSPEALR